MLTELDLRKVAVAGAFDDLRRDTMATMSHYSRVLKVVIDAPPDLHDQELAFWQGALGNKNSPPPHVASMQIAVLAARRSSPGGTQNR